MMFLIRSSTGRPSSAGLAIKLVRHTPELVPGGAGKTDYFCVGDAEAIAALRAAGQEVIELRDGWYADDAGGGVAIWGQGRYWEIREEPFTVTEAVGPAEQQAGEKQGELVNVRGAIFGV